jgi:hypothetical protein
LTNNTPAKTRNPVNKINSKNNCPRCEKLNGSLGRNKGGKSPNASDEEIGEKSEGMFSTTNCANKKPPMGFFWGENGFCQLAKV